MSEQYQRFKQNFLKQHPNMNTGAQSSNISYRVQKNQQSYKAYDPYGQFTNQNVKLAHNVSDQNLRIQNQNHFPFQEMQNQTFNDLDDDPFLSYKNSQKQNLNQQNIATTQQNNKFPSQTLNNSQRENHFFTQQQDSQINLNKYVVNSEYPDNFTSTKHEKSIRKQTQQPIIQRKQVSSNSRVQYWEHDSNNQSQRFRQQSQLERINRELENVRSTGSKISRPVNGQNNVQYNNMQSVSYQNNLPSNMPPLQNTLRPQSYVQSNSQFVFQAKKTNYPTLSPPKQLPVIYNTPNNLANSGHKMSSPAYSPHNSRVLVQGSQTGSQNAQFLPQVNSQLIQNHNNFSSPPLVQKISANSRVVIQSEMVGQNNSARQMPDRIPSTTNIVVSPPPVYNQPHQNQQIQTPKQILIHEGGMVSLRDFQAVKSQSLMWQQRYHQANQQLLRLQNSQNLSTNQNLNLYQQQQSIHLKQQNYKLQQKIRILQNSDRISHDKIKQSYEQLLKKYQDSLMKECNLLVDRFRLEMKHNQRY